MGSMAKGRKPRATTDRVVSGACLVRGRRRQSTKRQKRHEPSRLQSYLLERRGRVTEGRTVGDQHGNGNPIAVRQVLRRKKASWLPRRRTSSRRTSERGPRSVRHAGGSPSSRAHIARVTKGCSTRFEEGSHLSPFAGTAYEWEGRSFSRVSSAHTRTSPSYQPSSAQPTVEFGVPPRTRRNEERWSSALHSRTVSCTAPRKVSMVLGGSLPASASKDEGAIARRSRRTSAIGKRGLS